LSQPRAVPYPSPGPQEPGVRCERDELAHPWPVVGQSRKPQYRHGGVHGEQTCDQQRAHTSRRQALDHREQGHGMDHESGGNQGGGE
jgi:hypothetical protein